MRAFYRIKNVDTEKQVKNLGWVLRHSSRNVIEKIIIRQHNGTHGIGGFLEVHFKDRVFESEFADFSVLCHWLKSRKSWRGSKVYYYLYNQLQSIKDLQ